MSDKKELMEAGGPIKIGWGVADITPEHPVQLHGQHYQRISIGVHDPVTATVFAIEGITPAGASASAVLVSVDLVNISAQFVEEVRAILERDFPDIVGGTVVIAATHTHTGPTISEGLYPDPPDGVMAPTEYRAELAQKIADTIGGAWNSRAPATFGTVVGRAAVGFNRRVTYADGSSRMYGSSNSPEFVGLEGGEDHGVELMYTYDTSSTLTGVIVNLSCPSQVVEGKLEISADFWGAAREKIRDRLGAEVAVLALCSAAGDQSPRDLVRRGRGEADFHDYSGMDEMGDRIANEVVRMAETARERSVDQTLFDHHAEQIELPVRLISDEEAKSIRRERDAFESAEPESIEGGKYRKALRALERFEAQREDETYAMEAHVVRIGDIAFATNPFELFLDYGLQIKARSPAVQTFIVQLAGDRGLYLPTRRALQSGHYGTIPTESLVGPDGGEALVDWTVGVIKAMFGVDGEG